MTSSEEWHHGRERGHEEPGPTTPELASRGVEGERLVVRSARFTPGKVNETCRPEGRGASGVEGRGGRGEPGIAPPV